MRRPLVVVGLPASRRSEVAKAVAERSGRQLVVCSERGLLERVCGEGGSVVVDLSSEVWLDRDVRLRVMNRCVAVASAADAEAAGVGEEEGLSRFWRAAGAAFDEVQAVVGAGNCGVDGAAADALRIWQRDPIGVAAGSRSYGVEVGTGLAFSRVSELLSGSPTNLVVTDTNVERLYGPRFEKAVRASGGRLVKVVFEAGEPQKTLETLSEIYAAAQKGGIDRSSRVVGIGGGVVTDIAGFAAATWMRGVRWFGISTTLLGMVDASVGGKTAVDYGEGKNAVGAFWQPSGVVCDTELLATETERNFRSALAEVVKTAVIGDVELFGLLESRGELILKRDPGLMAEVVRRCVTVKARVVGEDETERGVRATLNLGHTVGHAIESGDGFGRWSHGEAVSLGLVAALRLGERLGFTPGHVAERIVRVQAALGLPVDLGGARMQAAAELVGHDKKKSGSSIRFVVVEDVGRVGLRGLVLEDLREMVRSFG